MGVSDRIPLKLKLLDLYIPLKARMELPEGETWKRDLSLAGRDVAEYEDSLHFGDPDPLLDVLKSNSGVIVLGDPGAGKTTFVKYLAVRLARGEGKQIGLDDYLPILLPLAAFANALQAKDIRLDDFIAEYFSAIGSDLPIGPKLGEALKAGRALILLDGLDEVRDLNMRNTVLDAHMPEIDGFALAIAIHEQMGLASPPLLLLTSGAHRGDARRCRDCGIAAYFPKPVAARDLAGALSRLFGADPPPIHRESGLVTRHSLREGERTLNVLLVEDHPINQKLACSLLEKWGHRVEIAGHGAPALDLIESGRQFDIVLMDMQMPVMGGIEATERIRSMEIERGWPRMPIVAMTANAMQSDREACLAAGRSRRRTAHHPDGAGSGRGHVHPSADHRRRKARRA